MAFGGFVRSNLRPAVVMTVGAIIAAWGFGSTGYEMWTAGQKPWALQLIGFVVFVIGVVSVLYRQHQTLEERLKATVTPTAAPPVVPKAATDDGRAPAVEKPKPPPKERAPAKAGPSQPAPPPPTPERSYLPASFTKRFIALLCGDHTDAQRDAMLRPHIGQWLRLGGELSQVSSNVTDLQVIVRQPGVQWSSFSVMFPNTAEPLLSALKPGARIKLDAQIVQGPVGPRLANGELL